MMGNVNIISSGAPIVLGSKVAVVFSSANAKSFTYYNTFSKFNDLSIIFVRDPFLTHWYQSGVGGVISSWPELMCAIRNMLSDVDCENILFFGSSMGGYAALRASLEFPKSVCVALSPQTILDSRLPHNIKNATNTVLMLDSKIALERNEGVKSFVIYGAADPVDLYHAFIAKISPINLFPIYEGDHLTSAKLHKHGFLDAIIKDWLRVGQFSIKKILDEIGVSIDMRCFDPSYNKLVSRAVEMFYLKKDFTICDQVLDELFDYGGNSGTFMLKGRIQAFRKNLTDCQIYFKKALEISENPLEPAKQLGAILIAHGLHLAAIDNFNIALSARPNDYDSLCGVALAYAELSMRSDSISALVMAVRIRPAGTRAQKIAKQYGFDLTDVPLIT